VAPPLGSMESALDALRDGLIAPVERAARAVHGKSWQTALNDARVAKGKRAVRIEEKRFAWSPEVLIEELGLLLTTPKGKDALLVGDPRPPVRDLQRCCARLLRHRNAWAHRHASFDAAAIEKFKDDAATLLRAVGGTPEGGRSAASDRSSTRPPEIARVPSLLSAQLSPAARLLARTPAAQPLSEALENIRVRRARLLAEQATPVTEPAAEPVPIIDAPETFGSEFWKRKLAEKKPAPTTKGKRSKKAPHLSVIDGEKPTTPDKK